MYLYQSFLTIICPYLSEENLTDIFDEEGVEGAVLARLTLEGRFYHCNKVHQRWVDGCDVVRVGLTHQRLLFGTLGILLLHVIVHTQRRVRVVETK